MNETPRQAGTENLTPDQKDRFAQALAMGEAGHLDQAADGLMAVAAEKAEDFGFQIEAARQLENLKRYGKAQEIYARTMKLEPDNFLTYSRLGALYVELEKYPIAIKNLEHAVKLSPKDPDLHYNLGLAYQANNDIDNAIKSLEESLALGGRAHLAFGTLARIYEQTNQMDKLGGVLDVALQYFPDDSFLNFNAAIRERRQGSPEKALQYLEKSLNSPEMLNKETNTQDIHDMKMIAGFEYGRIYDKLGQYGEAYKAFERANKAAGDSYFLNVPKKEEALKNIEKLDALDLKDWCGVTADPLEKKDEAPIFLVGFPRSGTTLLQQVLDGHSKLEVLEEKSILAAVTTYIDNDLGEYPKALETQNTETFNSFRDEYMNGAKKLLTKKGNIRIVDKLPLNTIQVPLIKKMFPDAKFILALRHPCDCTLSCFMQNFGLNHAMMNFLNLDDATHYYDQVFRLWFKYLDAMDVDYVKVRYEDVVVDLEKEARAVISFLGLQWEDAVLDYREQAKAKKRINTPSYSQVVQPIYKDASGRWKHYEKHLEPYLKRLQPYCKEFGYSL